MLTTPNRLIPGKGNEEGQGLVSLISYLSPVIIWNPSQHYLIYFQRGIKCPICEEDCISGVGIQAKTYQCNIIYMILTVWCFL